MAKSREKTASFPEILQHDPEALQRFQFFHSRAQQKPVAKLTDAETRLLLLIAEWAIDFQSVNNGNPAELCREYEEYKNILWNFPAAAPDKVLLDLGLLAMRNKSRLSGINAGNLHVVFNILLHQEGFFTLDAALKFIDRKCNDVPGEWLTYKAYRLNLELAYSEYSSTNPSDRVVMKSENIVSYMILAELAKALKLECSLRPELVSEYVEYIRILQNRGGSRIDHALHELQNAAARKQDHQQIGLLHCIITSIDLEQQKQDCVPVLDELKDLRVIMLQYQRNKI